MSELKFKGATLLSKGEARQLSKKDRAVEDWWWLREFPNIGKGLAGIVIYDGTFNYIEVDDSINVCVRPALILSNLEDSDYTVGDKFRFAGELFTIISDRYALCDCCIDKVVEFRKDVDAEDANDYEKSDAKKFVDSWFNKHKNDPVEKLNESKRLGEKAMSELKFKCATLLSEKEAESLPLNIRSIGKGWWLRTGHLPIEDGYLGSVAVVGSDGFVSDYDDIDSPYILGARPALLLLNLEETGYKVWDKFKFAGDIFTIISENYALCDDIVGGTRAFGYDIDYEKSDVKKFVDYWFRKHKNDPVEKLNESKRLGGQEMSKVNLVVNKILESDNVRHIIESVEEDTYYCDGCGKPESYEDLFWFTSSIGFCDKCDTKLHKNVPQSVLDFCYDECEGGDNEVAAFIIDLASSYK